MEKFIKSGSLVNTDKYDIYGRLVEWGYEHKTVCPSRDEYAQDENGDAPLKHYRMRFMCTRWRDFGRYCVVGCVLIEGHRRSDCRCMWAFFSLFTMFVGEGGFTFDGECGILRWGGHESILAVLEYNKGIVYHVRPSLAPPTCLNETQIRERLEFFTHPRDMPGLFFSSF